MANNIQVTDKKSLIDQACQTANDFINIYYKKIDGNRQTLAKTYLDSATLSWNGNRIDGKLAIIVDKSLHFSFFAKKQRKFRNLCKDSKQNKEIAEEKNTIFIAFNSIN